MAQSTALRILSPARNRIAAAVILPLLLVGAALLVAPPGAARDLIDRPETLAVVALIGAGIYLTLTALCRTLLLEEGWRRLSLSLAGAVALVWYAAGPAFDPPDVLNRVSAAVLAGTLVLGVVLCAKWVMAGFNGSKRPD